MDNVNTKLPDSEWRFWHPVFFFSIQERNGSYEAMSDVANHSAALKEQINQVIVSPLLIFCGVKQEQTVSFRPPSCALITRRLALFQVSKQGSLMPQKQ